MESDWNNSGNVHLIDHLLVDIPPPYALDNGRRYHTITSNIVQGVLAHNVDVRGKMNRNYLQINHFFDQL